jgi:hypothetical protein
MDGYEMDLSRRLVFEERHRQEAEFLKKELETCLRSAKLASMMLNQTDGDSAARTTTEVEKTYTMVRRFLSNPLNSKHLTIKEIQERTVEIAILRKMLNNKPKARIKESKQI